MTRSVATILLQKFVTLLLCLSHTLAKEICTAITLYLLRLGVSLLYFASIVKFVTSLCGAFNIEGIGSVFKLCLKRKSLNSLPAV